jgi:hypothetical protein
MRVFGEGENAKVLFIFVGREHVVCDNVLGLARKCYEQQYRDSPLCHDNENNARTRLPTPVEMAVMKKPVETALRPPRSSFDILLLPTIRKTATMLIGCRVNSDHTNFRICLQYPRTSAQSSPYSL